MITETLDGRLATTEFQTQLLKVVFTYLYVDVKEPAEPCGSRSVWNPEFLRLSKLKTVVVCLIRGRWWAWQDSNLRPCAYQAHALTN